VYTEKEMAWMEGLEVEERTASLMASLPRKRRETAWIWVSEVSDATNEVSMRAQHDWRAKRSSSASLRCESVTWRRVRRCTMCWTRNADDWSKDVCDCALSLLSRDSCEKEELMRPKGRQIGTERDRETGNE
jgi:hypothetical protein